MTVELVRKKTSIRVDEDLWPKFVIYATTKHGSGRKVSEELEAAITEYMKNHPLEKSG